MDTARTRRGSALIAVLVGATVVAMIVAAVAGVSTSHYMLAKKENDYATALAIAEAGINYELRKISAAPGSADQAGANNPPGVAYSFGGGEFRVYCINQNGSTPWVHPSPLHIISRGTYNGVSRIVRIEGASKGTIGEYSLYGIKKIEAHSTFTVNGNVGTNGSSSVWSTTSIVNGALHLNGPDAVDADDKPDSYTTVYNAEPVDWPTVDEIINERFSGGWSYIATTNDNAMADIKEEGKSLKTLAAAGNKINVNNKTDILFRSKEGGANYYVTSIFANSEVDKLRFDNSAGPINVWVGPSGANGSVWFKSKVTMSRTSNDPLKRIRFYHGTKGDFRFTSTTDSKIGIYAYNVDNAGKGYGKVIAESTFTAEGGSMIGWDVEFKSTTLFTLPTRPGYFESPFDHYGFKRNWTELENIHL